MQLLVVALFATSFTCIVFVNAHSGMRREKKASPEQPAQFQGSQSVGKHDFSTPQSRMPRYAKVNGSIETLWQPPRGSDVKGILFVAHGCKHQATDFFYGSSLVYGASTGPKDPLTLDCSTSNYGSCLALPEERQLVEEARGRGLYVVAVSGGSGTQSCWDLDHDSPRVKQALDHVIAQEGLPSNIHIFATGASSGGALMGPLALELGHRMKCIVPQVSALHGSVEEVAARRIPTLFVHMAQHDAGTAQSVESDIRKMQANHARVQELKVAPVQVMDELSAHYTPELAKDIEEALKSGNMLQNGYLARNPRESNWRNLPGLKSMQNGLGDSFVADESKLAEILNAAWCQHEFTARYAKQMLDFCNGQDIQA